MKTYRYSDAPLEVHGLPFYPVNGLLERLPHDVIENLRAENPTSGVINLSKRTPGARICFRTNSKRFTVRMELAAMNNRQKKMGYNAALELLRNLGMDDGTFTDTPSPKDEWQRY